MTVRRSTALAGSLVLATLFFAAPIAQAEPVAPNTDEVVSYALDAVPGGYATSEHTGYWPELGMTLVSEGGQDTQRGDRAKVVGSCGNGAVCAYSGSSLSGSKLSWSSCGTHSTAALSSVRSIANARSSETLRARNGSTVLASTTPGTQKNVSGSVTNIYC